MNVLIFVKELGSSMIEEEAVRQAIGMYEERKAKKPSVIHINWSDTTLFDGQTVEGVVIKISDIVLKGHIWLRG